MTLIKNIVLEDVIEEDTRRSEDERRDQTQNIMDLYIKTVRLQQKDVIIWKMLFLKTSLEEISSQQSLISDFIKPFYYSKILQ